MADPFVRAIYNQFVTGTGVTLTRYPAAGASVTLTASGKTTGAYKYAAANANVAAIVAKNTVGANFRIVSVIFDTLSTTGVFVAKLGSGTGATTAIAQACEVSINEISGVGVAAQVNLPMSPTIVADGANDAILGDGASVNTGQDDTFKVAVIVAKGMGS